jgi:N-acetylmuramoyl-L-alanine amidase
LAAWALALAAAGLTWWGSGQLAAGREAARSASELGFEAGGGADAPDEAPLGDGDGDGGGLARPEGPLVVALQAGHWLASEAPDELANLRGNGATAAGYEEWAVNLAVAQRAAQMLEERGVRTLVLPTTVPPDFFADAFVALHADEHPDEAVSGYKLAAPRRDRSGHAAELLAAVDAAYAGATGLTRDHHVTENMRGYYAFNHLRYEHALHPLTPAIILELGYLSNPTDRELMAHEPEAAARGVADGVMEFLARQGATPGGPGLDGLIYSVAPKPDN